MKRILIFGMTENQGGIESFIMNYYRNIDKSKLQFDFICNTNEVAYEDEILKNGGNIYKITARSKNYKLFHKELDEFFRNNASKYNSIWVNVCSLANIDYLKFAKRYKIKHRIIHCHNSQNMDSLFRGLLHRWNKLFIKKYATDFWTCSDNASKWFYRKEIIKSDKYLIINNAIDSEKFKFNKQTRDLYRKNLKLENKLVIGNIARFHFQKNHTFLIEIFNELYKKDQNVFLLLVGTGEDEDKIKQMVCQYGLQDSVMFLGMRRDISEIIQAMDIFVFPSLFEGLPITLIEAQANGLPIFTSKDVIPKEIKMSENLEFISLKESPQKWAEKIIKANLTNKSEKNIKIINDKGFDIKDEVKKMEKFF